MKKVEADTLEEAYQKAATLLECSITHLECEVIQYPTKGIFGLLKKKAIIVADIIKTPLVEEQTTPKIEDTKLPTPQEDVATQIVETIKDSVEISKDRDIDNCSVESDVVIDNFFSVTSEEEVEETTELAIDKELSTLIEKELKELIEVSCFDIDIVEVDVVEKMAYIFIDGDDAALLIGKEGYRYNALSYMLFNWLNSKYDLYIKLEIAEFIESQREMIKNYIKPVIEEVNLKGRGKTRFLDGILVQLALEELRGEFPHKYVAIKTAKNGKKFVVINDFNTKPPHV
jgi:spoIIIJ-associated protein